MLSRATTRARYGRAPFFRGLFPDRRRPSLISEARRCSRRAHHGRRRPARTAADFGKTRSAPSPSRPTRHPRFVRFYARALVLGMRVRSSFAARSATPRGTRSVSRSSACTSSFLASSSFAWENLWRCASAGSAFSIALLSASRWRTRRSAAFLEPRGSSLDLTELFLIYAELRCRDVASRGRARVPDLLVDVDAEKLREKILPLRRFLVKKAREVALGQHDTRRELLEVETEKLARTLRVISSAATSEEAAFGLEPRFFRSSAASRCFPDHANGRVEAILDREVEAHFGFDLSLAYHGMNEVRVCIARDASVERKGDGVDDARLAGAGGSGQNEEIRAREIDRRELAIGGEAFELELNRAHRLPPAVR